MAADTGTVYRIEDYRPSDYLIPRTALTFRLSPTGTRVVARLDIERRQGVDPDTPLEETVIAMADLIRSGKVRYFGVSNYRSWRLAEICNICDRLGIDRPVVSQPKPPGRSQA
jgi:aryl-alcohol dehydrogenase-like predicted oxidoreductase